MPSAARYAIYYAPRETDPLWRFGIEWLGRDPISGETLPQPQVPGLSAEQLAGATESPRQYGFHATLKPPFHLADDTSVEGLCDDAVCFAKSHAPFDAPPLQIKRIGRFQAFALTASCTQMETLAGDCVVAFDRHRAPAGEAELAKRRERGLTDRQERYLQQWGYPYVMEEFQFHMTVLGSIRDETVHEKVAAYLAPRTVGFAERPLRVDAICLYGQETRAAPFLLVKRFPFGDERNTGIRVDCMTNFDIGRSWQDCHGDQVV
jgi:putative phosphonate metabolism protein